MWSARSRTRLALTGACVVALAIAACAESEQQDLDLTDGTDDPSDDDDAAVAGEGEEASVEGDEVQLRMTWWGSDTRHQITQEAIEAFNEQHPEIGITAEFLGWDGYWERLATQIAGGNAPDLIQMDYRMLNEYVARGTLLALDNLMDGPVDMSDWSADTYASGMVDGQHYALPWGLNTATWIMNDEALEAAGLEPPDTETWTWEDLSSFAQEIADNTDDGFYGTEDNGGNEPLFETFLIGQGKNLYTEGGELAFDEQDLIDWWTLWDDMRRSGAAVPAEEMALHEGQPETSPVVMEDAGMTMVHSNQFQAWSTIADVELSLHRVPSGGGAAQYLKPSMFISASADTEHPDEVALFMDFILNDQASNEIQGVERGVPGNLAVRAAQAPQLEGPQQRISEFLVELDEFAAPTPQAPPPGAGEIDELLSLLYEEISFEQTSIEDAVDRLFSEAPLILEQAG
jgi:multiple sugar transport system substrate-binding protein